MSELQASIWGSSVEAPASLLKAMVEAGGVVVLALQGDRPVGFVYGFTGLGADGKVYHRSHAAGVLPEARDAGLGRRLKSEQRRRALQLGLNQMVWTFDPAQLRNAHFNLRRLGAVGRVFRRDYYGGRIDAINRRGHSDRLVVEWYLAGDEAAELERLRAAAPQHRVKVGSTLLAPLPAEEQEADYLRLRQDLETALAAGFSAVDYDQAEASYRFARLPDWFPSPAEGSAR